MHSLLSKPFPNITIITIKVQVVTVVNYSTNTTSSSTCKTFGVTSKLGGTPAILMNCRVTVENWSRRRPSSTVHANTTAQRAASYHSAKCMDVWPIRSRDRYHTSTASGSDRRREWNTLPVVARSSSTPSHWHYSGTRRVCCPLQPVAALPLVEAGTAHINVKCHRRLPLVVAVVTAESTRVGYASLRVRAQRPMQSRRLEFQVMALSGARVASLLRVDSGRRWHSIWCVECQWCRAQIVSLVSARRRHRRPLPAEDAHGTRHECIASHSRPRGGAGEDRAWRLRIFF